MGIEALSDDQRRVLARRFDAGFTVLADLSWGLVDTVALHLRVGDGDVLVKAAGAHNHHIAREITGNLGFTDCWTDRDLAPHLVHHDLAANLLVTTFLPGTLATDTAGADDPGVHRQAGAALALFHRQAGRVSEDFEARQTARCLELLEADHRIRPDAVAWLTSWLTSYQPATTTVVPTHGDFSPRNWLVDNGQLRVIDLGRFDWRPRSSDLVRLHKGHWRERPDLAAAFLEGYGHDPRSDDVWTSQLVREAIGTAVWAFQVGDEPFEREGHQMIEDLISGATVVPR